METNVTVSLFIMLLYMSLDTFTCAEETYVFHKKISSKEGSYYDVSCYPSTEQKYCISSMYIPASNLHYMSVTEGKQKDTAKFFINSTVRMFSGGMMLALSASRDEGSSFGEELLGKKEMDDFYDMLKKKQTNQRKCQQENKNSELVMQFEKCLKVSNEEGGQHGILFALSASKENAAAVSMNFNDEKASIGMYGQECNLLPTIIFCMGLEKGSPVLHVHDLLSDMRCFLSNYVKSGKYIDSYSNPAVVGIEIKQLIEFLRHD